MLHAYFPSRGAHFHFVVSRVSDVPYPALWAVRVVGARVPSSVTTREAFVVFLDNHATVSFRSEDPA